MKLEMIVVKFFEFQRIPFNEDMYYVYEHSIEGKVFYVGKGCKDRAIVFTGRNELWNKHVGKCLQSVEVNIVGLFEREEDALIFEENLILKHLDLGENLCNISMNKKLNYKKYMSKKRQIKSRDFSNKIDVLPKPSISSKENLKLSQKLMLLQRIEDALIELNEWNVYNPISKKSELLIGEVKNNQEKYEKTLILKKILELKKTKESDTCYLSEIFDTRKINLKERNMLIVSPEGSGKTTFIKKILKENKCKSLILTSKKSTSFEDLFFQSDEISRVELEIMTYKEFGEKIRYNNDFFKSHINIFCEDFNSLIFLQEKNNNPDFLHSIKALFGKYKGKSIFYFDTDDSYLIDLEKREKCIFENIVKFDFRETLEETKKASEYNFKHIDQIKPHLASNRRTSNSKCISFVRNISGQKKIARIAEEIGFKPLILWSINNVNKMSDEQLRCRNHLIETGLIPEGYDFLIINSSSLEEWCLKDPSVKIVIMNTTSEIEKKFSFSRILYDIEILFNRIEKSNISDSLQFSIPEEYLNIYLTKRRKDELCEKVGLKNHNGVLIRWPGIRKLLLESHDYIVEESTKRVNGKATRVTIISLKKDSE